MKTMALEKKTSKEVLDFLKSSDTRDAKKIVQAVKDQFGVDIIPEEVLLHKLEFTAEIVTFRM